MAGIEPPEKTQLPPGPRRDLVLALHGLYRGAGRPGLRRIASAINEADMFPDTVSHETASAALRGENIPRWSKLECLVRQLSIWHHPRLDPDVQVSRFLALWNAANGPGLYTPADAASTGNQLGPEYVNIDGSGARRSRAPVIWGETPYRNKNFTGRAELLQQLSQQVRTTGGSGRAVALHGIIGAGTSQVALEYAYRHRSDYDVVWWIPCEVLSGVRPSLAALATRFDLESAAAAGIEGAVFAVVDALRRGQPYDRCLLIFDGADQPEDIVGYIPDGPAHVLITSRNPRWRGVLDTIAVDVFRRAESVEFLARADLGISEIDANSLAEEVGDLPLALAQTAMLIADKGMAPEQCIRLISEQPKDILARDIPYGYPASTTEALHRAISNLEQHMPEALTLLRCLAFLGPDPVPLSILRRKSQLPAESYEVGQILTNPILLSSAINYVSRYGLARTDRSLDAIQIHRLTQAMLRDQLTPEAQGSYRNDAQNLLADDPEPRS